VKSICINFHWLDHSFKCSFNSRYLAVFDSQVPLRKTKVPFSKGDVTNQPATGVLPWRENRYKIKNRKVLLLIDYFKAPADLFEMMAK
jgi:hypothetical protein